MNSYQLKIIAITAMFIDHFGAIFITSRGNHDLYLLTRIIGRLAFPIFVFLIIEGFYHTSNVKKYLLRLGLFALLSEIPFDLAFYKYHNGVRFLADLQKAMEEPSHYKIIMNRLMSFQNVFFTLFLGLLLLVLMSMVEKHFNKNMLDYAIANALDAGLTIIVCICSFVLRTDYSISGILMIVAFFLFRGNKTMLSLSILFIMGAIYCDWIGFLQTNQIGKILSIFAVTAMLPIAFYNGEKGKNMKYLFYIFYPAHLFLFFLIEWFLRYEAVSSVL